MLSLLESVAENTSTTPTPMRNEDLFILLLQDWESSDRGEATRERASSGWPGNEESSRLAADFLFADRQGREMTSSSLGTAATPLMFPRPRLPPMRGRPRRLSPPPEAEGVRVVVRHSRRSPAVESIKAAMPPA